MLNRTTAITAEPSWLDASRTGESGSAKGILLCTDYHRVMSFSFRLSLEGNLLVATGAGRADLPELLELLDELARYTQVKGQRRAMADLSSVVIRLRFTDYLHLGMHAARHLSHLERGAAVVRPEDYRGVADMAAQKLGLPARIFTSNVSALHWLADGVDRTSLP